MYYLDTNTPMINFEKILNDDIYVDKSMLIEKTNQKIGKRNCYVCITRPRRFGKTSNVSMLGAYYTVGYDAQSLFKGLMIENSDSFQDHLNKHHVIYIDFSRMPKSCNSFDIYYNSVYHRLMNEVCEMFSLNADQYDFLDQALRDTNDRFVFLLDEWDSIFYEGFMSEDDKKNYLKFLKGLLKDQPYVELAFMTGVLPIAKYTTGSELNMFDECSFLNDHEYEDYYGFGEKEVKELCKVYTQPSYEELKYWYDGYYKSDGSALFNPRSVSFALSKGYCKNYWTETGPMNEVADVIEHNVDEVREDIVKMVSGIPVEVELDGYGATQLELNSRDEILSAMVVYGFLSYHDHELRIPNRELMEKFEKVLKRESMGAIAEITKQSKAVLQATLAKDSDTVAQYLEAVHDHEIPFLKYNDENSLSCVVTLCYLYARDHYDIEREMKSGKGYVDYLFTPKKKQYPPIILELKYDKSAKDAIDQIYERKYIDKVKDYQEVLLVGINYDTKSKRHECIIETYQKA